MAATYPRPGSKLYLRSDTACLKRPNPAISILPAVRSRTVDEYRFLEGALILILQLSMPVVAVATVVGLVVGLLQALTQIQDQTLPQAVKLVAVTLVIIVLGAGLSQRLVAYTTDVFERIAAGGA